MSAIQARPRGSRVILVEPRGVARMTLREIGRWYADLEIVDEVANGEAAVTVVRP